MDLSITCHNIRRDQIFQLAAQFRRRHFERPLPHHKWQGVHHLRRENNFNRAANEQFADAYQSSVGHRRHHVHTPPDLLTVERERVLY